MKKFTPIYLFLTASMVMFAGQQQSKASLLQLTHDPLFLNQTVPPAIAVTFDDSGSMAWGFMGQGLGNNGATYDARAFTDPTSNRVYFNPTIQYQPPIGANGVEYPQSNFTSAKIDGFDDRAGAPTVDLSTNFLPIARYYYFGPDGNFQMRFARIPNTAGVDTVSTNNFNDAYPDAATRGATGRAAFYYIGNTRFDVTAAQQNNFANWYTYYSNRNKMGKTAVSRAFATFGPNFKIAWQQLNNNTTFPAVNKFELTHRNNFFNWLFSVPANGGTPLRNAFQRAGQLFEQQSSYFSPDFSQNLSCQQNFHIALSDGQWNGGYTSTVDQDETAAAGGLPGDSDNLYGGYTGSGGQKIYGLAEGGTSLADIAYHFWANDLMTGTGFENNVKRFKSDFIDVDGTVIVPAGDDWAEPAMVWNPKNDPAYWQHVVTYNVGMGLNATVLENYIGGNYAACALNTSITDPKEAVLLGLRGETSCNFTANDRLDDVWHASVNSRGDFFSANNPEELTDALNNVVNSILERLGRGSTSTVSSGVVTSSTNAYTPGFDSSNWTGNLFSRKINSNGTFQSVDWDMACNLTGGDCEATGVFTTKQTNRNIYTYDNGSDTLLPFNGSLSGEPLTLLAQNAATLITNLGISVTDIIDYIGGDQSQEIQNGGQLRDRNNVLADIVHSSPVVQRGPSGGFSDLKWPASSPEKLAADAGNGYLDYQINNQDRHNLVYIGSNGGMLHAINAEGANEGQELWSFIPSKALDNIHRLVNPLYQHWSFVDNSGVISDAFFGSQWHTILISGMRYGGQAFFALDVTNTTSNQPDVLWEFTDEDDADMGFSYGKATIVKIASTQEWVALIPNGYNNSQKDFPSLPDSDPNNIIGDGSAVLYVVRLSDGQLLAKLDTNVGTANTPNGMAQAVGVVSEEISKESEVGIDVAYAGDLYGNLWRFNFESTNYADWETASSIHRVVTAQGVKEQPITTQPRVISFPIARSADRDTFVMFATGKYIEIPDRSINLAADQWVVGFYDGVDSSNNFTIDGGNLVQQTLTTNGTIRNVSMNTVDYVPPSTTIGWKLKLPQQGERVANPLALFSQFLLVTSTVTAGDDPCLAGGISWLLAVDPLTGSQPNFGSLFEDEIIGTDINGDPITLIEIGDGIQIPDLIIGTPPIVENLGGGAANIIVEGTDSTTVIGLKEFTWRRRGWHNLLTN